MASARVREGQPVSRKVVSWLSKVFELNPAGLNWPRAVLLLDVMLVPLVVFWAIGHDEYLLSALFGAQFAVLADPGGSYRQRVAHRLLRADRRGADRAGVRHRRGRLGRGAALWIAVTFVEWLVRGCQDRPQPVAEIPGDTARRKLTRPLIMFAVIRALVIAGTVALAFGLNLSHGVWMPIAAIVPMKPSLQQTTLVGAQRLAGALIGAAASLDSPHPGVEISRLRAVEW